MKTTSAQSPCFGKRVPHLMCKEDDVADIVLLPGDPGRVKMFAELCNDFKIVATNREFDVGTGFYKGVRISVCSTGIGAPSTEIAVIQLIELGAKALIRIGGTGSLRKEMSCGDMIINTAATRQGGASRFYVPEEYPAVASFEVVECLIDACKNNNTKYWKGIAASVGSFFAGQARPAAGKDYYDKDMLEKYKKYGIVNLEMESETIFVLGSLYNVYVGSICAVHANRETDEWMVDFADAQKKMCSIAQDAGLLIKERYL